MSELRLAKTAAVSETPSAGPPEFLSATEKSRQGRCTALVNSLTPVLLNPSCAFLFDRCSAQTVSFDRTAFPWTVLLVRISFLCTSTHEGSLQKD